LEKVRLPDDWNGKLVAGASGARTEFNGGFAWSDYVAQKGYAYVSQSKGIFNFKISAVPVVEAANPGNHVT
jgi:hypothetical protein